MQGRSRGVPSAAATQQQDPDLSRPCQSFCLHFRGQWQREHPHSSAAAVLLLSSGPQATPRDNRTQEELLLLPSTREWQLLSGQLHFHSPAQTAAGVASRHALGALMGPAMGDGIAHSILVRASRDRMLHHGVSLLATAGPRGGSILPQGTRDRLSVEGPE